MGGGTGETWAVPVETGMIVELAGLSRTELNGRRGECLAFDSANERWGVRLGDGGGLSVRPSNLTRAPPAAEDAQKAALQAATAAADIITRLRVRFQGSQTLWHGSPLPVLGDVLKSMPRARHRKRP
eukprot:2876699-Prymnesium_polylepis.1